MFIDSWFVMREKEEMQFEVFLSKWLNFLLVRNYQWKQSICMGGGVTHPAQLLVLQSQNPGALCEQLHFDWRQRMSGGEVSLRPPPETHMFLFNPHTEAAAQSRSITRVSCRTSSHWPKLLWSDRTASPPQSLILLITGGFQPLSCIQILTDQTQHYLLLLLHIQI